MYMNMTCIMLYRYDIVYLHVDIVTMSFLCVLCDDPKGLLENPLNQLRP
jgi:hypothetical protein